MLTSTLTVRRGPLYKTTITFEASPRDHMEMVLRDCLWPNGYAVIQGDVGCIIDQGDVGCIIDARVSHVEGVTGVVVTLIVEGQEGWDQFHVLPSWSFNGGKPYIRMWILQPPRSVGNTGINHPLVRVDA